MVVMTEVDLYLFLLHCPSDAREALRSAVSHIQDVIQDFCHREKTHKKKVSMLWLNLEDKD